LDADSLVSLDEIVNLNFGDADIKVLPLYSITRLKTYRSSGWGDMLMIANVGFQ
jgi:hypothetical protein